MTVDYDEVLARAKEARPKLIVCGGSAYPRTVETDRFRAIADEVGAILALRHGALRRARRRRPPAEPGRALRLRHLDDPQDPRRPARRLHPLPRGAREGASTRAVIPGMQGGPLEHTIAAKATCFRIAMTDAFREYQTQVRRNADALAETLLEGGLSLVTGGTDTHLLLVDLRESEWTGKAAEERLHEIAVTVNRNTVPFDERSPFVTSGVRLGSPAMTMRGFDEDDFREVGRIICEALDRVARPRRRCAPGSRRSARSVRSTRASAATRRTSRDRSRRLTVVAAPAVQHKLSYLRDKETPTVHFRKLANEITLLLTYEATKDMPTEPVEIETPLERMTAQRISGKKVAVCPVLRAGVGMLDGVLSLVSSARVGFIGMYRDEETLEPVQYYLKLPDDLAERDAIVLDPMLATGHSSCAAIAA